MHAHTSLFFHAAMLLCCCLCFFCHHTPPCHACCRCCQYKATVSHRGETETGCFSRTQHVVAVCLPKCSLQGIPCVAGQAPPLLVIFLHRDEDDDRMRMPCAVCQASTFQPRQLPCCCHAHVAQPSAASKAHASHRLFPSFHEKELFLACFST